MFDSLPASVRERFSVSIEGAVYILMRLERMQERGASTQDMIDAIDHWDEECKLNMFDEERI